LSTKAITADPENASWNKYELFSFRERLFIGLTKRFSAIIKAKLKKKKAENKVK
jgi:hypothetical protein